MSGSARQSVDFRSIRQRVENKISPFPALKPIETEFKGFFGGCFPCLRGLNEPRRVLVQYYSGHQGQTWSWKAVTCFRTIWFVATSCFGFTSVVKEWVDSSIRERQFVSISFYWTSCSRERGTSDKAKKNIQADLLIGLSTDPRRAIIKVNLHLTIQDKSRGTQTEVESCACPSNEIGVKIESEMGLIEEGSWSVVGWETSTIVLKWILL